MVHKKRPKSVRKARAAALAREEKTYAKAPHSFVFTRPGVGSMVKQLSLDLREIFEPFTASRLRVNRRNVIKDFVAVAGPLNVTHMLYVTHPNSEKRELKRARQLAKKEKKSGTQSALEYQGDDNTGSLDIPSKSTNRQGVYLHLVRVPHGPSLTFRIDEYSLKRDIQNLVHRVFDLRQYSTAPLLAMVGFGSLRPGLEIGQQRSIPPPHLRLIVDMFQNLLPPLNVQKLKLGTVRRVLLISREVDPGLENSQSDKDPDDMIYIRHYHIRTEDRGISRALRRLGMGGNKLKRQRLRNSTGGGVGPGGSGKSSGVPNLSKYTCMEDFLTKTSLLSDSALSDALSDMEEVELPQSMSLHANIPGAEEQLGAGSRKRKHTDAQSSVHGLRHLGASKRATIRLTEIGPRLTLRLIKIEEGLNTGTVLYHRWQSRSLSEVADQNERLRNRELLRAKRRAEHEAHRAANEAAREAHRAACLEGMRKAGQLPVADPSVQDKVEDQESVDNSDDSEKDSSASDDDDDEDTSSKPIFVPHQKKPDTKFNPPNKSKRGKKTKVSKISKKVSLTVKKNKPRAKPK